jgi:hypothetical protein
LPCQLNAGCCCCCYRSLSFIPLPHTHMVPNTNLSPFFKKKLCYYP